MKDLKNMVVIYTGCGDEKKKVVLYNFSKIDHYEGKIRVLCDDRYYYFRCVISVISKVEIY